MVVYVQSPMISFIYGLKKKWFEVYLDLIFDSFERIILPSILTENISNIKKKVRFKKLFFSRPAYLKRVTDNV